MAFLGFLGPARMFARSTFFDLWRKALATDDGKRLLADSLAGLTRPGIVPPSAVRADAIYPELPAPGMSLTNHQPPIFITARFRSGSTLLWNIFRHVQGCTSFYEPLNERRWFDPATRGTRVDSTHLGVDDYWREYEGLEALGRWYREEWTSRRLFMDHHDWDAGLAEYIGALIAAAPQRAALQFNRVDFRLSWLRRHFPQATIVHLYRHPRDQWCSTLVDPARVPPTATVEEFAAHDGYYLLSWARDLSYYFPFLDPRLASHPYELFYYLWRLSFMFGTRWAHASVSFEKLCASPSTEIPALMEAVGITRYSLPSLASLIERPDPNKTWTRYAAHDWFAAHERRCEDVLARWGTTSRLPDSLETTRLTLTEEAPARAL